MDLSERRRVQSTFEGYREDERKQRAWSAEDPGNRAIRDEIVAALEAELPDGPLLDVGCGTGWWLRRLADGGRTGLHGLDVQPERAERAAAAVPEAEIVVGDARRLPFADGAFAAVTMLLVLSSLSDRAAMLSAWGEARRVLGSGGRLLAWDVRFANPRNRATVTPPWRELGGERRSITLLPALARRLPRAYPALARVPPLRSHRLVAVRKP